MADTQVTCQLVADCENHNQEKLFASVAERLDLLREEHPYVSTVVESAAVWAGRQVVRKVSDEVFDVAIGHGWANSRAGKIFNRPALAAVTGLALAPVAEEFMCRKVPSDRLDLRGKDGLQAWVGYVVAGLFAAGHAGKEAVPATQFIGGLNYWRLQRSRGFSHAVVGHITQNALSLTAGLIQKARG